jgi:serine protease Do
MGLFVTSVNQDGPAFDSGIVPGDIIIKIGEERVQSQMQAQALFREYSLGDSMRVQLLRDNDLYEAKIKLRSKVSEN